MDANFLSNKVILVLSPQSWGKMKLAKHHYAIELAKRGNDVYFLNPPDNHHWSWSPNRIVVSTVNSYSNLFVIDQQLYFPYNLKFHSRVIYELLIKKQIRNILKKIRKPVDIIWSFDLGNLFPLKFFNRKAYKIFHPVDEPADGNALLAGQGADILFSVTREILDKYKNLNIPSHFINHGLADEFILENPDFTSLQNPKNVGISGNLLRQDLDRETLLKIVSESPGIVFHFYGSHLISESNIGAMEDAGTEAFIHHLKLLSNVRFHGVLGTKKLSQELNQMDALLICYDIKKDQSGGTNYHKVMEYISTGKVIVSNNITTYRGMDDLVIMTDGRENNDELPILFKKVMQNLDDYNTVVLRDKRRLFALDNTYKKQLSRISTILERNSTRGSTS